ncbi:hypothetical protein Pla144_36080 [Bythopirellula polymerisocia]|uniref:Uncharacterized protein n=1 Tax=Bythopirellula polymerisocia TaxID=2528003 RepID=A0A5C6CK07_9BACT|nr:hypothetical protein Pla144_36080 [Bythopirellula polymerisocia]
MPCRSIQIALLLSVACLLAVESGQLRDHVRHEVSNGYSAEVAEEIETSDCSTDPIAIGEPLFTVEIGSFLRRLESTSLPEGYFRGPPSFQRGPPLS